MNYGRCVAILPEQYFSIVNDSSELLHDFAHPISEIVGELLVKQAYENPNALKNATFNEKRRLRCPRKEAVPLDIGPAKIQYLEGRSKLSGPGLSRYVRALLWDYLSLTPKDRQEILATLKLTKN